MTHSRQHLVAISNQRDKRDLTGGKKPGKIHMALPITMEASD